MDNPRDTIHSTHLNDRIFCLDHQHHPIVIDFQTIIWRRGDLIERTKSLELLAAGHLV
jgi:hypothetical protein